ncbi:hypothetical protein VB714_10610 [Spirulina sp. 06S082]|nr:hypothetical protein [Spirulina sp. 06S082]
MMTLPRSLEENFTREIYRYEEENKMPYITSVERLGIEKGLQEGRQEGRQEDIIAVLQVRFETVSDALVEAVNGIQDEAILTNLLRQAIAIPSLDAFQDLLNSLET